MKALTIKQPWAGCIAHGDKDVENRTWALPEKHFGTRILIHAGRAFDQSARRLADELDEWQLTSGAVVALATLTGCHFANGFCCAPWGESDAYHWTLADVAALPEPVPAKGALGLWTPSDEVVNTVLRQETGVAW